MRERDYVLGVARPYIAVFIGTPLVILLLLGVFTGKWFWVF
jgi:ABC-type arginine/histidine transport system permease subunit